MNEKKKLSEEIKIFTETFENINSPHIIQDILHLSIESSQIELELQNNTIKSLLSINENLLPILDNDYNEENFNPFILSQNKKSDLYRLNFEKINITNTKLNEKIGQYNELSQKINEFKKNKVNNNYKLNVDNLEENKKSKKKLENQKKEEIGKKLFLIQHPLISLFKEKIKINELKNEIKNEYLNKMKDNTNYKYLPPQNNNPLGAPLPLLLDDENIVDEELDNDNNEDNEDNEDNDDDFNEDAEVEEENEQIEPILPPLPHPLEEENELPEPILPPLVNPLAHNSIIENVHQENLNNDNNNGNNENNNNNDNINNNNNENIYG